MNLICWPKGCAHSGHCGPSRRHPGLPGAQLWGLHSHPILCKWTWFLKLWNMLAHTVEVRKESKMWASQGKTASLLDLSKAWNCASGPFRWNRGAAFIRAFNTTRHLLRAVLSTVWWGMQICMKNMYWSGGALGKWVAISYPVMTLLPGCDLNVPTQNLLFAPWPPIPVFSHFTHPCFLNFFCFKWHNADSKL